MVLLILVIVNLIINPIIKLIMKAIYGNKRTLPLLGLGYRPNGNKVHCGVFPAKGNKVNTQSFGMPSGHSEIIWSIVAYSMTYLYYAHQHDNNFAISYTIKSIILISIGLFVSLSRVYMGCHTVQQVILGGLVGAGTGIGAYYIYPNPPKLSLWINKIDI